MIGINTLNLDLKDNAELSDLLADAKAGDNIKLCVSLTVKTKSDEEFSAAVTECGDLETDDAEEEADEPEVSVKNSDDEEESPAMVVGKKDEE
jgi:hypothetical protein